MEDDVRLYEPKIALRGGIDGYSSIIKVIEKSAELIKKNGNLILEIDNEQIYYVKKILKTNGFYINKIVKDLARNYRCVISTKI